MKRRDSPGRHRPSTCIFRPRFVLVTHNRKQSIMKITHFLLLFPHFPQTTTTCKSIIATPHRQYFSSTSNRKSTKMAASVTYSSTRGGQTNLDFRTVVMTGLAHDRGLFVPDTLPTVTKEELEGWRSLSYPDLAVQVISKFVKEDQVPAEKLADIVKRSCAAFRHEDVTPVVKAGDHWVLVSS